MKWFAQAMILLVAFTGMAAAAEGPTSRPASAISIRSIAIPSFPGAHSVWGAVGSDAQGHIWFGVSAKNVPMPSARLYEYDPASGALAERGDVNSELKRLGLASEGERQQKIHSRIVQAADGYLYFSSFDEEGEKADGSKQPVWGGHLWRLRMPERRWEHLLKTPEALIAVGTAGKWVYTLGYFGHVIYQLDCETGASRSIRVGSVDGHISRNFLVDRRGHVYVPRLSRPDEQAPLINLPILKSPPTVELVELDPDLREVGQAVLSNYLMTTPSATHGITALAMMDDGSIYFTTHPGWLYHVVPHAAGPAEVKEIGPFSPKGKSHAASLFTDGRQWLVGASRVNGKDYEWIRRDLTAGTIDTCPFDLTAPGFPRTSTTLLYGSMARDNGGDCYVVGGHMDSKRPIVLRVHDSLGSR